MNKFKVAFNGLFSGMKDRSIALQYGLGLITIIVLWMLKITLFEWFVVILCLCLVIGFEYLNTAIERLADVVMPNVDQRIKYIKDLSAAAVLIQAVGALIIMMLIIGRCVGGY